MHRLVRLGWYGLGCVWFGWVWLGLVRFGWAIAAFIIGYACSSIYKFIPPLDEDVDMAAERLDTASTVLHQLDDSYRKYQFTEVNCPPTVLVDPFHFDADPTLDPTEKIRT